jgi:hypothetical protein
MANRGSVEMSDFFLIMFWIVVFGVLLMYCDRLNK